MSLLKTGPHHPSHLISPYTKNNLDFGCSWMNVRHFISVVLFTCYNQCVEICLIHELRVAWGCDTKPHNSSVIPCAYIIQNILDLFDLHTLKPTAQKWDVRNRPAIGHLRRVYQWLYYSRFHGGGDSLRHCTHYPAEVDAHKVGLTSPRVLSTSLKLNILKRVLQHRKVGRCCSSRILRCSSRDSKPKWMLWQLKTWVTYPLVHSKLWMLLCGKSYLWNQMVILFCFFLSLSF